MPESKTQELLLLSFSKMSIRKVSLLLPTIHMFCNSRLGCVPSQSRWKKNSRIKFFSWNVFHSYWILQYFVQQIKCHMGTDWKPHNKTSLHNISDYRPIYLFFLVGSVSSSLSLCFSENQVRFLLVFVKK